MVYPMEQRRAFTRPRCPRHKRRQHRFNWFRGHRSLVQVVTVMVAMSGGVFVDGFVDGTYEEGGEIGEEGSKDAASEAFLRRVFAPPQAAQRE